MDSIESESLKVVPLYLGRWAHGRHSRARCTSVERLAASGLDLSRAPLAHPLRATGNPQPDQADRRRAEEMPAADRSAEPGPAEGAAAARADCGTARFQDLQS